MPTVTVFSPTHFIIYYVVNFFGNLPYEKRADAEDNIAYILNQEHQEYINSDGEQSTFKTILSKEEQILYVESFISPQIVKDTIKNLFNRAVNFASQRPGMGDGRIDLKYKIYSV